MGYTEGMDWKLSVLFYVITYSFSVIIQKSLLKDDKSDVLSRSVFFQIITGLILLIWSIITRTYNLSVDYSGIWLSLIVIVIFYAYGNLFIFKSLKQSTASSFSIYFSLRVFVTLLFSYFLFNQSFSIISIVGLLLLIAGIIIVDYSSQIFVISKAEMYAMIAAVCIGATNSISQFVMKTMNLNTFLMFAYLTPAVFMIIIKPKLIASLKNIANKKNLINYSVLGLIQAVASIFFFHAIEVSHDSALVTAVSLSSIVLTVILSFLILKERGNFLRKLIAAIVTFIGLMLLV